MTAVENAAETTRAHLAAVTERIADVVASVLHQPTIDAVHGLIQEAGVRNARQRTASGPDELDGALRHQRTCQEVERQARDAHDRAVLDAEWPLAGCFEVRSNKQWLVKSPDGKALTEDQQRSMTADEKKAWIAHHAGLSDEAQKAAKALRKAEADTAAARDEAEVARARISISKHELDAAVAQLNVLATALPAQGER
jgi:hypothetical protein